MKNKKIYFLIIFILFLSVSIGYAAVSWKIQTLSINSDVSLIGSKWNIKLMNPEVKLDNISNENITKSSNDLTKTKYTFDVELKDVNDVYTLDLAIENNGKLDGEIESISFYVNDNLIRNITSEGVTENDYLESKYLEFTGSYWDNVDIKIGDLFKVLTNDSIKLTIKYIYDESVDYLAIDKDVTLAFEINFKEKTNAAKERNHTLNKVVKVGDYISLNSFNDNSTNNTIELSKNITGMENDQTVTLDNLNLWRVIYIDEENNTLDLASEYVTTNTYSIKGETGFINYVNILNGIAEKYTLDNDKILSARVFGYNNQKLILSSLDDEANNDQLYENDYAHLNESLKTLVASKIDGTPSSYSISSRYKNEDKFGIYIINNSGVLEQADLVDENEHEIELNNRMIINVKSDVLVKNNGTIGSPYLFE